MKLNIAYPSFNAQATIEIEDELKVKYIHGKRIGETFEADQLGDKFVGYVFKICGGSDKQGFAMKQGVMTVGRTKLLLKKGQSGLRFPNRNGERQRKNVRGCIVSEQTSVLNVVVLKKGENELEGVTDQASFRPKRLQPKRANNIRKAWVFVCGFC